MNTSLLCRCSLTNQEPGTTTTTPKWPRKQVLNATVTPKMSCRSWMLTLLHNVYCVPILCLRPVSGQKALADAGIQYSDIEQACVGYVYGEMITFLHFHSPHEL